MRIARLDLVSFGHHRGTSIDLHRPDTGLTVVWGPNEAGKSTTRRALIGMLFGIPRNSPDAHGSSVGGLELAACLVGEDGEVLEVRRKGTGRKLSSPAGETIDQDVIDGLMHGVGREHFERLFCVDHDELRTGSEELLDAEGEIGRLVFGSTLGVGSVAAALRRLDERATELFSPRGRKPEVNAALARFRALMDQARDQRVRSRELDVLRDSFRLAGTDVEQVRRDRATADAELTRLQRLRTTLPLVHRRAQLLDQRATLERSGPIPSSAWAQEVQSAQLSHQEVSRAWSRTNQQREQLEGRMRSIHVDTQVLGRADTIDELVRSLEHFRQARADVDKRRGELTEASEHLSELLGRLGMEVDDGRLVADRVLVGVEELAKQRATIDTQLREARGELAKAEAALHEAQRRLDGLPPPHDVDGLRRALTLAAAVVPVAAELQTRRTAVSRQERDARAMAAKPGLGDLSFERIASVRIPDTAVIGAERERQAVVSDRLGRIDKREGDIAAHLADVERQLSEIALRAGLPDPDRLAAARARRQELWVQVRSLVDGPPAIGPVEPLVEGYEVAVADADTAADSRFEHAEDLARLDQLRTEREHTLAQRRENEEERRGVLEEDGHDRAAWSERWADVGGPPDDPERWREDHGKLLALIADVVRESDRIADDTAAVQRHVEEIGSALGELGIEPTSEQLGNRVAQGQGLVDRAEQVSQDRATAQREVDRSKAEITARRRQLESIETSLEEWSSRWGVALEPLSLPPSTTPAAAMAAVRDYRALLLARSNVTGLARRVEGIERIQATYSAGVREVASGLVDVDVGDRSPDGVVDELRQRLEAAREASTTRAALETERDALDQQLAEIDQERLDVEARLAELRSQAGLAPDAPLEPAVEAAVGAGNLGEELANLETGLLRLAPGCTLDDVVAEVAANRTSPDELAAAEAAAADRVAELEVLRDEAQGRLGEARHALDAVTGSQAAADVEQEAQTELALAADRAGEYARTLVAAEVLRRVVRDYGERHRGPILERAARLFSELTGGAFTALVPHADGDRQVLLARRGDDDHLGTDQLSDGTRDQLYLALRLAGIEYQLDNLEAPVPVVMDDVLVHFDDVRSRAALGVLGELGRRTQVLVFTHHEEVVELAAATLAPDQLAVVRLPTRVT